VSSPDCSPREVKLMSRTALRTQLQEARDATAAAEVSFYEWVSGDVC
jgi:hypothetical protein